FAPHWIGDNIPNNQNGWIEEDAEEEEEDPDEDPEEDPEEEPKDDDDDMEMDDKAEHIPHVASFGQNFHFGESSSTANLLTGNSKIVSTGPISQVREPPAGPSARPIPAPYPDDPYVVTRDDAIADAAIATSGIDD
nr:hypothetical protein [Tanacetum cinerariifolium]